MKLPAYLDALNLAALPIDYEWDNIIFNTFWACNDEDNPRLVEAMLLSSLKAAYALGIASAEWVAARLDGHTDVIDLKLRIEAAWASTVDWRYANLPMPEPLEASAPRVVASPVRLSKKLLAHSHEQYATGDFRLFSHAQGQIMLVDHIAGRAPAFAPWLAAALRTAALHYPVHPAHPEKEDPVDAQPAVPREMFEPGFVWSDAAVEVSQRALVASITPATNPYLRPAAEMRSLGFAGVPYGRSA